MKVFISWSGEQSKAIALKLRGWLPLVIQNAEPWMSGIDIGAGERWSAAIEEQLEETDIGILCITHENVNAPWILFEAGALAKKVKTARVVPYLVDLDIADLPKGPLTAFMGKKADKEGTLDLLNTLFKELPKHGSFNEQGLKVIFERMWPDFETALSTLLPPSTGLPARTTESMLSEVLEEVRTIKIQLANSPKIHIGKKPPEKSNDGDVWFETDDDKSTSNSARVSRTLPAAERYPIEVEVH